MENKRNQVCKYMRPIYDLNVAMSVTLSSQSTPVLSNYKDYQSRIVTACLMGHMESKIPY